MASLLTRRWAWLLLLALSGCPAPTAPTSSSFPAAHEATLAALTSAQAAFQSEDFVAVQQAAAIAEAEAEAAASLLGDPPAEADVKLLAEIQRSAAEAETLGALAKELAGLRDEETGMRAKAYRAVRATALAATFEALALAADQAAQHEGALPERLRPAAELAGRVAHAGSGRPPPEPGQTDWVQVASDLRVYAKSPPPRLALILASAYLALGHDGLALNELQDVEPESLTTPNEQTACRVVRALTYRQRGYPRLALTELEPEAQRDSGWDPELQAGIHLLLSALYLEQGSGSEADAQLALAIQAWPESPPAVFLTGERRAASGAWEPAAASLEQAATGTSSAWLAEQLGERAREIRDAQGPPERPLLNDPVFVRRLALETLAGAKSQLATTARATLDTGRELGGRVLERVPGFGSAKD